MSGGSQIDLFKCTSLEILNKQVEDLFKEAGDPNPTSVKIEMNKGIIKTGESHENIKWFYGIDYYIPVLA
ncbi:hypothetical protein A2755_03740 [Candidatus Wolfebacteria bacterium RIFCSPHIGHO2_01_FULL_48_22]|uniref:Uncharacterized protein n=2 Tax=Candidatus Wolfeibacteriota TaxID=1752735 RepID=A0A1F8DPE2_9BACT|nr:MAG: hypothetical protein A2755_03740 [Candidatus Wolfebacteria bacterium RIFCSPHIGHO2_01_FULL_48_22]OGM93453.1 MAG: hypothetical protein A2935_01090 [Candidatus Wolfebacteria bacterium RIFCSPLOWO2_01_FULL_47_17b]